MTPSKPLLNFLVPKMDVTQIARGRASQIRAPKFSDDNNVPFSTLIEPSNPTSGPYGGMSVGVFPVEGSPCLIALGTGTTGLHPDEAILARPGHARKAQAICEAINRRENRFAAWAKHDPTRTDLPVPANVTVAVRGIRSAIQTLRKSCPCDLPTIGRSGSDEVRAEGFSRSLL